MADVNFLLGRSMKSGGMSLSSERDTGISSNSIVAIAYGIGELSQQELPSDSNDLQACRNMWHKLPGHRQTEDAIQAMVNAENFKDKK